MKRIFVAAFLALLGVNKTDALEFEKSVPSEVVTQVLSDLDFIGSLQGSRTSPLHAKIFGPVDGAVYRAWFSKRVGAFGYAPVEKFSGTAIAYNDSNLGRSRHMVVTDYFVKGDLPQIARLTVLFHEARHSEPTRSFWFHTKCPTPFKDEQGQQVLSIFSGLPVAGKPACDTTAIGAYGISAIMMGNVALNCANCSEKVKTDAALYGGDQTVRLLRKSDRKKIRDDLNTPVQ